MNLLTNRDSQTQEKEPMVAGGKGQGVWDGHVFTAIFQMDNQQGPIVQHMELCSMSCGSLDEGSLGKNGYMYMDESLHYSPENYHNAVNWLYANTK